MGNVALSLYGAITPGRERKTFGKDRREFQGLFERKRSMGSALRDVSILERQKLGFHGDIRR